MRRLGQIGAFKTVCADLFALINHEIGEKSLDKGIGEAIFDLPAAFKFRYLAAEKILFCVGDEANEI